MVYKTILIVDTVVLAIFSILLVVENSITYTGLDALSSVGRFVIYLGIVALSAIILIFLLLFYLVRRWLMGLSGKRRRSRRK